MAVTLSPKYQLVIPKEIRRSIPYKPGQKFEVFWSEGVLELVPVKTPKELRGFLKGKAVSFERDERDRF